MAGVKKYKRHNYFSNNDYFSTNKRRYLCCRHKKQTELEDANRRERKKNSSRKQSRVGGGGRGRNFRRGAHVVYVPKIVATADRYEFMSCGNLLFGVATSERLIMLRRRVGCRELSTRCQDGGRVPSTRGVQPETETHC